VDVSALFILIAFLADYGRMAVAKFRSTLMETKQEQVFGPGWLEKQLSNAQKAVAAWPVSQRRAAGIQPECVASILGHSRDLCHLPNTTPGNLVNQAASKPVYCQCCGADLVFQETDLCSYQLICPVCPQPTAS